MTRFPILSNDLDVTLDIRVRELFDEISAQLGVSQAPAIFRAMGLNPAVLRGTWEHFKATMLQGRVPTSIKLLAGQAIALSMGCPVAALSEVMTSDKLQGTISMGKLNPREHTMLDFAVQAATQPGTLLDADFEELRQTGLWDDEIFELIATAGVYVSLVNFGLSTGTNKARPALRSRQAATNVNLPVNLDEFSREELTMLAREALSGNLTVSARLAVVVEIGLTLMATPTFGEIFQILSDQAKWVLDFDQVSVSLLEEGGETYRVHTLIADCGDMTCEPTISAFAHFNASEGLPGVALSADRAIITADLALHPQASPRLELTLAQEGLRGEMVLPLRIGDRKFGTLNFVSKRADAYQADDLRIGLVLALQLATALEAARLYAQIEEERSMLLAILQSTTDGVLVVNSALGVAVANPPIAELLGVDLNNLLGAELTSAVTNPKLIELFEQALQGGSVRDRELSLSEDRTYHASITPVHSNFGEVLGYVAVLHDVTTLKSFDRMKNEFVSTVSHDLKNPISVIKLSASMLGKSTPLSAKQTEYLDRIERASDRMLSLVTDLLDLGKIEAGMGLLRVPCDLKQIALEVIDEQRSLAETKHLVFEIIAPDLLPAISGDAIRLKQVIANFVSNAVKYTPDSGQVTLAIQLINASIEFTVTDSGYGIPAKDLPYVFDKFYRVDSEHTQKIEGTGLGLAITRSIIEQHQGQVWATSQLGQGSTFGFRLAVQSNDSASQPEIKSTQAERHVA